MNWFLRTLGGAVIAGLGWKLGADAYEYVKKRLTSEQSSEEQSEDEEQAGKRVVRSGTESKASSGHQPGSNHPAES